MNENKTKDILIVERSNFTLVDKGTDIDGKRKEYVFEGVFAVLNKKNRNRRIYTEDQYLPQIDRLQPLIKENCVVGELNHPVDRFDIDFAKASHVVESLSYDKESGQVFGRIRLLNTPNGKICQALVEDRIPLNISSRAAGTVNQDGTVVLKELFTYDIVSKPGFEEARLRQVNEKYGFEEDEDFSIYEIENTSKKSKKKHTVDPEDEDDSSDENNTKTKKEIYTKKGENMSETYVKAEQFDNYTKYMKSKFNELNSKIDENTNEEFDTTSLENKLKTVENKYNKLVEFVNYLSDNLNKSIAHNDHIVENVLEMKGYVDYLALNLDESITYQKYSSGVLDKTIGYTKEVADTLNKGLNYSNHISEGVNKLATEVQNNRLYTEYVANEADKGIQYTEHVAEISDKGIQYAEETAKKLNEGLNYMNLLTENLNKAIAHSDHIVENVNQYFEGGKQASLKSVDEGYQSGISSKINALLEKANNQNTLPTIDSLHFTRFLDAERTKKFQKLDESTKKQVVQIFENSNYYGTSDVVNIFDSALSTEPNFIKNMSSYHKEQWNGLNENKKQRIVEQASNYILNTQYQIDEFWNNVDFRNEPFSMQQLNEGSESGVVVKDKTMLMYEKQLQERFGNRF